ARAQSRALAARRPGELERRRRPARDRSRAHRPRPSRDPPRPPAVGTCAKARARTPRRRARNDDPCIGGGAGWLSDAVVRSNGAPSFLLLVTFNPTDTRRCMKMLKLLVTSAVLLSAASVVSAQSLEIRKRQAEQEAELTRLTALTNKACGIELKTTLVAAS